MRHSAGRARRSSAAASRSRRVAASLSSSASRVQEDRPARVRQQRPDVSSLGIPLTATITPIEFSGGLPVRRHAAWRIDSLRGRRHWPVQLQGRVGLRRRRRQRGRASRRLSGRSAAWRSGSRNGSASPWMRNTRTSPASWARAACRRTPARPISAASPLGSRSSSAVSGIVGL